MILLMKKKLYVKLAQRKNFYNSYTYNRILQSSTMVLNKQNLYTVYIYTQEKNKFSIKEISGILLKKSKMQNLTNIHLLCLKRYNNIYISFFKESPNILIKYKI